MAAGGARGRASGNERINQTGTHGFAHPSELSGIAFHSSRLSLCHYRTRDCHSKKSTKGFIKLPCAPSSAGLIFHFAKRRGCTRGVNNFSSTAMLLRWILWCSLVLVAWSIEPTSIGVSTSDVLLANRGTHVLSFVSVQGVPAVQVVASIFYGRVDMYAAFGGRDPSTSDYDLSSATSGMPDLLVVVSHILPPQACVPAPLTTPPPFPNPPAHADRGGHRQGARTCQRRDEAAIVARGAESASVFFVAGSAAARVSGATFSIAV